jgi:hypothetical protein
MAKSKQSAKPKSGQVKRPRGRPRDLKRLSDVQPMAETKPLLELEKLTDNDVVAGARQWLDELLRRNLLLVRYGYVEMKIRRGMDGEERWLSPELHQLTPEVHGNSAFVLHCYDRQRTRRTISKRLTRLVHIKAL